jgi:peptide subunit release factor RF-3
MSTLEQQIARRRTFAIISHPDHLHHDTSGHPTSLIRKKT